MAQNDPRERGPAPKAPPVPPPPSRNPPSAPVVRPPVARGRAAPKAPVAQPSADDLFKALGDALDEIEREDKVEKKEYMRPTKDTAEVRPGRENRYKGVTRAITGSTDPLLLKTQRTAGRAGMVVTSVDRGLEDLLKLSIERARASVENRRTAKMSVSEMI